jgi:hypothetical protein
MLPVVFGFAGTGSFPDGPFPCVFTGAVWFRRSIE